jgi:enoyl-CoA hydratase
MSDKALRTDEDGLCTLTLNRPEKLNALDTELFEQLDAHLADLETQTATIGCVVLRGAGKGFCAGADLGAVTTTLGTFKPKVIQRLQSLPQPTIAAVHGVCFTGALELALACDFIVAEKGARFADTHGKWGLVGSWGMSQRLPRRIGAAQAKRMMFTARTVEAEEALALGLVDMLAEAGGLDALVAQFSADLLANSRHTNIETKKMMLQTEGLPLASALAHEQYHYPGFAPDFADRVEKFKKK